MYIHIWYIHAVWFCGQNKQKGFSFCQWMEGGSTNVYIYQWVDGCVCAYTHKNIHIYIHTYMYEHIQWIHNHVRTYIHTWHKRMYIHTYKNTHIRTYLHSYMYIYIHAYLHIYVHTCMHACTMTWYILTYTQWKICAHIHEYIHIRTCILWHIHVHNPGCGRHIGSWVLGQQLGIQPIYQLHARWLYYSTIKTSTARLLKCAMDSCFWELVSSYT